MFAITIAMFLVAISFTIASVVNSSSVMSSSYNALEVTVAVDDGTSATNIGYHTSPMASSPTSAVILATDEYHTSPIASAPTSAVILATEEYHTSPMASSPTSAVILATDEYHTSPMASSPTSAVILATNEYVTSSMASLPTHIVSTDASSKPILPKPVCADVADDLIELELSLAEYLRSIEEERNEVSRRSRLSAWSYATNLTEFNKASAESDEVSEEQMKKKHVKMLNYDDHLCPSTARQLDILFDFVTPNYSNASSELNDIVNEMKRTYSTALVCKDMSDTSSCLTLDPQLKSLFAISRDFNQLTNAWEKWHNAAGRAVRANFSNYVSLANTVAKDNGFENLGVYWRSEYADETTFPHFVEKLWKDIEGLYQKLHCYVKRRLSEQYPGRMSSDGTIPAYILGNLWAQDWSNIFDIVKPYPDSATSSFSKKLSDSYTPLKMHELSESFYKSLGFDALPPTYWTDSMLTKPQDINVICHPSAWDLCYTSLNGTRDLRIKMCTEVNEENMFTILHEQGHLFYDQSYSAQPSLFRNANDGFHEAIGDTIRLSFGSHNHLQRLNLLPSSELSHDVLINSLMATALQKLAFIPFGLIVDKFRWEVFAGLPEDRWNDRWWELRRQFQGVRAPVARNSKIDFDPGAKYHVSANVPYFRYFFAHILQFSLHKSLCDAADNSDILANCSIFNNTAAGKKLRDMLALGRSKPWELALESITGNKALTSSALLKYFEPLSDWLDTQNKDYKCAWNVNVTPLQPSPTKEKTAEPSQSLGALEGSGKVTPGLIFTAIVIVSFVIVFAFMTIAYEMYKRKRICRNTRFYSSLDEDQESVQFLELNRI